MALEGLHSLHKTGDGWHLSPYTYVLNSEWPADETQGACWEFVFPAMVFYQFIFFMFSWCQLTN